MDRLEAMAMLLAAVDEGSLSAAARTLGVPIPTLSRKVAELEDLIGAQLLTRTTRRLVVTGAGQAYVEAARAILRQVDEAERRAAGEYTAPRGELVVTASVLFGHLHVLPVITAFLALYPDIDVRLSQRDHYIDLVEEHVDMAVRFGALPDSAMISTRVGAMRSVVCMSPRLKQRHGEPEAPQDLRSIPCVSTDGPMLSPAWCFKAADTSETIEVAVTPRFRASSAASALQAAVEDLGAVRLLYYQAVQALERGDLEIVLAPFEPAPTPIHLVHVGHARMPLKTRRFLDFAAPRLRKSLAGMG